MALFPAGLLIWTAKRGAKELRDRSKDYKGICGTATY